MKKNKAILLSFILLIISFAIGLFCGHYYEYSLELEDQIIKRDSIITSLQTSQSYNIDSINNIYKEKVQDNVSMDQLINYTNGLIKEINILQDSLNYFRVYYSLSQKRDQGEFTVKDIDGGREYSYKSNTVDIDTVNQMLKGTIGREKELVDKINNLYIDKAALKEKIDMYENALNKYNIQIKNIIQNEKTISYTISAPQLDSALMLLPYYRKELKYDKKNKQWTIGVKRWF